MPASEGNRDQNGIGAEHLSKRRRILRFDDLPVPNGAVGTEIDPEKIRGLAGAVAQNDDAGDGGREGADVPRKASPRIASRGTPPVPMTVKSLRPDTDAAASRNDSVTLRFAW